MHLMLADHMSGCFCAQLTGHVVDAKGRKLAAPTISGNFDGVLTAHLEDVSERKLWEKPYPPSGPGRQVTQPVSASAVA